MKKVEFYPKRLALLLLFVLGIPLAHLLAKVADFHFRTPEEIALEDRKNDNPFIVGDDFYVPDEKYFHEKAKRRLEMEGEKDDS